MNQPSPDSKQIRIALVDDHRSFLTLVGKLLESKNFAVVFLAESGSDLFSELKVRKPDIILLDIKMPGMDGVECLIRLRKEHPEVKVIMFSQFEQLDFMLYCISLGAHCYLPKSTETQEVIFAIKEVYERGFYYSLRIRSRIKPATTD